MNIDHLTDTDGESEDQRSWTEVVRKQRTLPKMIKRSLNDINNDRSMYEKKKKHYRVPRRREN